MKNKKSLIALFAILLIAVIGVTFAYFQGQTVFRNVFFTGTYRLVTTEVFESPDNWQPGQEIDKTVTTTNEGTVPAAVRISYTEKWFDGDTEITNSVPAGTAIINFDNTEDWELEDGYYYYKHILNPGETTTSFIKSVTLSNAVNGVTCTGDGATKSCESTNPIAGATYKLILRIETIQSDKTDEWDSEIEIGDDGNNGNNGNNNGEVTPSCTPKYFEFGDPTTSSTTDYTTIQRDVMAALCEDGTKGVCIIKNNNLECFMQGNYEYEKQHLRSLYPNISCDGNSMFCVEREDPGFTINSDYSCTIGRTTNVGCGRVYGTNNTKSCRVMGETADCDE